MEKFKISIEVSTWKSIDMFMEPGKEVMEVAEKLSGIYPDQYVTVSIYARIRRSYLNGEIHNTEPSLTKFYTNVEPQMEWDWSCCGQVLS